MYFTIGLIIFLIFSFRVNKYNKHAYNSFIVESAPDQKETEIGIFWKQIKSASSKSLKKEIIISQSLYWHYHQKASERRCIAFIVLIAGIILEWYLY